MYRFNCQCIIFANYFKLSIEQFNNEKVSIAIPIVIWTSKATVGNNFKYCLIKLSLLWKLVKKVLKLKIWKKLLEAEVLHFFSLMSWHFISKWQDSFEVKLFNFIFVKLNSSEKTEVGHIKQFALLYI